MCAAKEGRVQIRPIAGTRPRGRTRREDDAYAQELLADPKERAEHLMLVDLARNDVGAYANSAACADRFHDHRSATGT